MSMHDVLASTYTTTSHSGGSPTPQQSQQASLTAKICEIFLHVLPILATLGSAALLLATGHPLALISTLACASWTVFSFFPELPSYEIGDVRTHTHITHSRPLWTPPRMPPCSIYQEISVLHVPTSPTPPTIPVYTYNPPVYRPVQQPHYPHYPSVPKYPTVPTVVDVTDHPNPLERGPVGRQDEYVDDRPLHPLGARGAVGRRHR